MNALINEKRGEIIELCRKFRVKVLELFGSATSDRFNPATSDLDFLVDYEDIPPRDHAACDFGLLFSLEELFGREVDLVGYRRYAFPTSSGPSPRIGCCSMRLEALRYLYDMQQACLLMATSLTGKAFADYEADPLLRSGVERQLTIVGEALNRLVKIDPGIASQVTDSRQIIAFSEHPGAWL